MTLVAFIVATALYAFQSHLKGKIGVLRAIPSKERRALMEKELNTFGIDASRLSQDQQYQLALQQLSLRSRRIYLVSIVIICLAIISGALALCSLLVTPSSPQIEKQNAVQSDKNLSLHTDGRHFGSVTVRRSFEIDAGRKRCEGSQISGDGTELKIDRRNIVAEPGHVFQNVSNDSQTGNAATGPLAAHPREQYCAIEQNGPAIIINGVSSVSGFTIWGYSDCGSGYRAGSNVGFWIALKCVGHYEDVTIASAGTLNGQTE